MTPRSEIAPVLDSLRRELWASGVSDSLITAEQIAFFILLRRLDLEWREDARSASSGSPFAGFEQLHWRSLGTMDDGRVIEALSSGLIAVISQAGGAAFAQAMAGARFALHDPNLVRACMAAIDRLDLGGHPPHYQGEVFSELLDQVEGVSRAGVIRTPPEVARLMIELVRPQPDQRICDPAVGTGELLVAAARHLGGRAAVWGEGLSGYDVNPGMVRLAAMNLLFHGVRNPRLEQASTISRHFEPRQFDVVVSTPPFGLTIPLDDLNPKLANTGGRSELAFLELGREMQRGSVAMLVPEAVLFGREGPFASVRRRWLEERCVQAVVLLPASTFAPYANVHAAIVLASLGATDEVWFCPLEMEPEAGPDDHARLFAAASEAVWAKLENRAPAGPAAVTLTEGMFSAPIAAIRQHNWSLSPAFYATPKEHDKADRDVSTLLAQATADEEEILKQLGEARALLDEIE